ncbi:MAG: cellulase family glycosylhydrolase [Actinobacteria bacterium]|nr:cellulase family glycosylhydrolase [Actinomycetota bacterium]
MRNPQTPPPPVRRAHVRKIAAPLALITALLLRSALPAGAIQSPLPGPISAWSTTPGTDGRVYIADERGRARQFHGFNIKTDDPDVATDELLAAAAERGLNLLRLTIYWDKLEPSEGVFDEGYLDRVVNALDRAAARGIVVILDMHQDVFGPAFGNSGIPIWATRTDGLSYVPQPVWLLNYLQPAVQAAWEHLYEDADLRQFQIRAWTRVVQRVKDHPALLGYDLLNEPFGKIREGEDILTAAARVEREQLTPMYQRLTDAISAIDPDHWVFFEPPNLASLGVPTSLGAVNGPKVAFYPHMYDPSIEVNTYTPGGTVAYNPEFFKTWSTAIGVYPKANPIPFLVGEWGIAQPEANGMDTFVRDSLATLDKIGSGWTVFNWCKGDGYCPLDAAGNDRPAISQIFQPYALAIAGAPTASVWDTVSATLKVELSDDASTGATEIFIPESRSYPGGWKVETSDGPGSWSSTFNSATGVLSVTTAKTSGSHAICVKPAGAAAGCAVTVAPSTTPATGTAALGSSSPAVAPVVATPRFTG